MHPDAGLMLYSSATLRRDSWRFQMIRISPGIHPPRCDIPRRRLLRHSTAQTAQPTAVTLLRTALKGPPYYLEGGIFFQKVGTEPQYSCATTTLHPTVSNPLSMPLPPRPVTGQRYPLRDEKCFFKKLEPKCSRNATQNFSVDASGRPDR